MISFSAQIKYFKVTGVEDVRRIGLLATPKKIKQNKTNWKETVNIIYNYKLIFILTKTVIKLPCTWQTVTPVSNRNESPHPCPMPHASPLILHLQHPPMVEYSIQSKYILNYIRDSFPYFLRLATIGHPCICRNSFHIMNNLLFIQVKKKTWTEDVWSRMAGNSFERITISATNIVFELLFKSNWSL